jgi:hypothetical protein
MPKRKVLIIIYVILATALIIGLGLFFFLKSNSDSKKNLENNISTTTPISTIALTSTTVTTNEQTVKIYFSKSPQSYNDFDYSEGLDRKSSRIDIGTFTIEELIKGPSTNEQISDYFTPLRLNGDTNCGKDFTLNIKDKIATLKFCRNIETAGIGDDARITTSISKTLKQFSTIEKVIILTKDDNCFGDMSGLNNCKN